MRPIVGHSRRIPFPPCLWQWRCYGCHLLRVPRFPVRTRLTSRCGLPSRCLIATTRSGIPRNLRPRRTAVTCVGLQLRAWRASRYRPRGGGKPGESWNNQQSTIRQPSRSSNSPSVAISKTSSSIITLDVVAGVSRQRNDFKRRAPSAVCSLKPIPSVRITCAAKYRQRGNEQPAPLQT